MSAEETNLHTPANATAEEPPRRPSRILLIPAIIFVLFGGAMVAGSVWNLAAEVSHFRDVSASRSLGWLLLFVAGVLWMFAARYWRLAKWWQAIAYTSIGWLAGGFANQLLD
jgi:cell division protein FtsW (lipid II flippase)